MAAHDDEPVELREAHGVGLREAPARGRREYESAVFYVRRIAENGVQRSGDRLETQHHTGAAAVRCVVRAFGALAEVEEMMDVDRYDASFGSTTDNRQTDDGRKHLREKRDQVDRQHFRLLVV